MEWTRVTDWSWETPDGRYYIEKSSSGTRFRIYTRGHFLSDALDLETAQAFCNDYALKLKAETKTGKYNKRIRNEVVDVYDILSAFNVTCPALQHAIKKLLMPGQRGAKNRLADLIEARQALDRAIDMELETKR